jgi:hypothetical protein
VALPHEMRSELFGLDGQVADMQAAWEEAIAE